MNLPLLFFLELIHPFAGRQSWVCEAVIAKTWYRKNTVKEKRAEEHGECLKMIDMVLTVNFPSIFHTEPPVAEKA